MGKRIVFIMNIVFLAIIVTLLYQAFRIYLLKEEIDTEIMMLEEKIDKYSEKKKKLEEKISNFSEEEKVERIARDRLNLKKEGETVYQVINSNTGQEK